MLRTLRRARIALALLAAGLVGVGAWILVSDARDGWAILIAMALVPVLVSLGGVHAVLRSRLRHALEQADRALQGPRRRIRRAYASGSRAAASQRADTQGADGVATDPGAAIDAQWHETPVTDEPPSSARPPAGEHRMQRRP